MESNNLSPDQLELKIFYDDFLVSGLMTADLLARLLESAAYSEDVNTDGASLDILGDDEMVLARVRAEVPSPTSGVVVSFAGVEIGVPLEQFKKDIGFELA